MTYNADVKERIITAFKALLNTKELSDITVLEICQKAEITKSTFYRHYRDKFQIQEDIVRRHILYFIQRHDSGEAPEIYVRTILRSIESERPAFRALFRYHGQNSIDSFLKIINQAVVSSLNVELLFPNINIELGNGHARCIILRDWITSDSPVTDELVDSLLYFLSTPISQPAPILPMLKKNAPELKFFSND